MLQRDKSLVLIGLLIQDSSGSAGTDDPTSQYKGKSHLTCINLTQETAQELSAWICHQCKANVGSVDFLKDSVLQTTGAIQELRHELAILENKVIQSSVAEGNKNADEFHGSEQSKLSFNVTHKPVP